RLVQEAVHPEANIIFGAVIDDTLGDEVRVTVIAAGFDGGEPTVKRSERRSTFVTPDGVVAETAGTAADSAGHEQPRESWAAEPEPQLPQTDPAFDDEDSLDIPDFLK